MRLGICAFGTLGDVLPLLCVAEALQAEGHDVTCVLNPFMVERAAARGLTVVAAGDLWDPKELAMNPRLLNPRHVWGEVFRPQIRPMFAALQALHEAAPLDGIVNHIWCFGGALAAEALEIPWAMVGLAPVTWFSRIDPPQMDHRRLPEGLHRWGTRWIVYPVIHLIYEPGMQAEARALGLPGRAKRFWGAQRWARLNLGLWSEAWRGERGDDPPNARLVGFPRALKTPPLSDELAAWLDAGEPPVVMGLGSALPSASGPLYRRVADACAARDLRLVCVGADPAALEPREGLRVEAWAPYEALFARARVIVHHGGIGSTAEALRAGAPSLTLSFGNDQHANGLRDERAGVGLWLPKQRATPGRVGAALDQLLIDEAIRAQAAELGARARAEPPGQRVAAEAIIEAFSATSEGGMLSQP